MRYSFLLYIYSIILFLPFLFAGCDSTCLDTYPNLGDIEERPPMPSIQLIDEQKKDLLKTQQHLQKEKEEYQF